jgi:phage terminase large subunit GpA-like protein
MTRQKPVPPNKILAKIRAKHALILELPSPMLPSEWADQYRILSREANSKGGKFTSLPWQREPIDELINPEVQGTVMQWASQVTGKTETVNNATGYFIQHRPRPILNIQYSIEMAQTWSKDRLAPMLRDTPILRGLVRDSKSRQDGEASTMLHKTYPGGRITIVGSNSAAGLASRPIGFVQGDEIDRWEASAGEEGDPWSLALVRTESFPDAVWMMTSTPTIKGISRIEKEMAHSDKRMWFVPCVHCRHWFVMQWKDVRWPEGEPQNAYLECPGCHQSISDEQRIEMVAKGEWRPTAPFTGIRGYLLNGIVALFKAKRGFKNRLHQAAVGFLKAKKSGVQTLKVWTNTFLAETWEEEYDRTPEPELLYSRRESYATDDAIVLPERCVVLAVGADVQADRIEAEISGWGAGEESWGIEYQVFRGNIAQWTIWNEFDAWIQSKFRHVSGHELAPAVVAIDSAHNGKMVYAFAQRCAPRAVFAVRGVGTGGMPWVTGSKTRSRLKLAKVNTAKETIYSRLKLIDHGPGYCHFPETYSLEWFQQLTSERMITRYRSGIPERHFEAQGRNEALDCRVYAMAGIELLHPNYRKITRSLAVKEAEQTEPASEPHPHSVPAQSVAAQQQQGTAKQAVVRRVVRRASGWMRGM